jgi:hypothetical protein
MKRELSGNCTDDFKIIEKELRLRFNSDKGLGLYSRNWCDNFYGEVDDLYTKCSDLEEFKKEVEGLSDKYNVLRY